MTRKKYFAIYKSVKENILNGEYAPGERLPSKRVMADLHGCSVITVESAYRCLCDEGYIYSKERYGYFVTDIKGLFLEKNNQTEIPALLEEKDENIEIDFECSVWFKTIRKVILDKDKRLFIKSPNMGCHELRNTISQYLLRYRGMKADPERIVIGSGSEHLYEMVIRILGPDKIYGIEDPCYSQIEAVYTGFGAKVKKLPMGKQGILTSALEKEQFDVLHVTPFKSYPTDIIAPIQKRYEYINWAKNNNKFIVEDDFNSEFFMPGNPVESLYSLDNSDSVIYMNTFSKSISQSIRIGYMIIPEKLMDKYNEKMGMYSCTVPVLDQYVLSEFIKSGNFERHLNRMRRKMKDL